MIMAGYEFLDKKPFDKVYFTGIVRDKQGRKMSKQFGNSPDLLGLIEQFGSDAVRFSVMISSPAGNDLLYDESALEQGRNFSNKMWNALKLVKMWEARTSETAEVGDAQFAMDWMEQRINEVLQSLNGMFDRFSLSEALKSIYSLIWDDFCSWYLEWVKPAQDAPLAKNVYDKTIEFYERLLQLLHPFMPFITEEIYHQLKGRKQGDDLMVMQFSKAIEANETVLSQGAFLKELITNIRDARNKNQLKNKDKIKLSVESNNKEYYNSIKSLLAKQVNAEAIDFITIAIPGIAIVVGTDKLYLVHEGGSVDTEKQKAELKKELEYMKGFLQSVQKKLSNEKFVQNAKEEVINNERKKEADAQAKIKTLEESLNML